VARLIPTRHRCVYRGIQKVASQMRWFVVIIGLLPWSFAVGSIRQVDHSASDNHAMCAVFGDRFVSENIKAVREFSARLSDENRFEFLCTWVLPGETHAGFRLAGEFTPANPPPMFHDDHPSTTNVLQDAAASQLSRVLVGGNLVAPSLDLVDVAAALGRLDELRSRIERIRLTDLDNHQKRARTALLVLVHVEAGDASAATIQFDQLVELFDACRNHDVEERWPETLALERGIHFPPIGELVSEMLDQMKAMHDFDTRQFRYSGSASWDRHFHFLLGERQRQKSGQSSNQVLRQPSLKNWSPASRTTARSRGGGFQHARWQANVGQVSKRSGHDDDYLFYRIPLRGDYEVECDLKPYVWQNMQLMVCGTRLPLGGDRLSFQTAGFRGPQARVELKKPIPAGDEWARCRVVVREGTSTTYLNGLKIHAEQLTDHADPWLAICCSARDHGTVRHLRITGNPTVPDQILLTEHSELRGWAAYFNESVGRDGHWQHFQDSTDGRGVIGLQDHSIAGAMKESLLRYKRPMLEDGTIEYEFYYQPGSVIVHPALDRLAFMIEPGGIRLHWVTDGKHESHDLEPGNRFIEPEHRRGPEQIPLRAQEWNKIRLTLHGDTMQLQLNDQVIYERPLEPTNQRTIGFFHYADRSEARVRSVVWSGDWPKQLPSENEQELGVGPVAAIDASLAGLADVFEHDFASDGLPLDQFTIHSTDQDPKVEARPNGLHIQQSGMKTGYRDTWLMPQMKISGNFEITAAFEDLRVTSIRSGMIGIALSIVMEDKSTTHGRIFRGTICNATVPPHRAVQSEILQVREGEFSANHSDAITEEASSGRLRITRLGGMLHCLLAEGDSSQFRLIQSEKVSDADLRADGVRLMAQASANSADVGSLDVIWKHLTIRAEKIVGLPVRSPQELLAKLDEHRETLGARFHHDFTKYEADATRFSRWGAVTPWTPNPNGLRIVSRGATTWSSSGLTLRRRVRGDFDVTMSFTAPLVEKPVTGELASIYLHVSFPGNPRTNTDAIFCLDENEIRSVLADLDVRENGERRYQRLKTQPVQSAARLRLVRHDSKLIFMFAENESARFQILAQTDVTTDDIPASSIRLFAHGGGDGRTTVLSVKSLELRADVILDRIAKARADRGPASNNAPRKTVP